MGARLSREGEIKESQLLLAEYERIKEEQKVRIGFRDNLLYVSLASMAAVVGFTFSPKGHIGLLLALPLFAVVLGWAYVVNDQKISAIGEYVRTELSSRLASLSNAQGSVFAWENYHRSDNRRVSRKFLQLSVDLITFCGSSMAAIVTYFAVGPHSVILTVCALVELIPIAALGQQIVAYADLRR
ncbi:hypothetical protein [Actinomadura madurae]|nr:hypothetical protein [Actinomadura madurae]MCP9949076.1 hypothetical protein [Actinomadura madurae]MCP9978317.1 hypothetical protein [Actinomadura madurae]MCQ0014525.1 hypothetical protein [Actinomadura madurae]